MNDKGTEIKKLEYLERKCERKDKIYEFKIKNQEEFIEVLKCEKHSVSDLHNRISENERRSQEKIQRIRNKKNKNLEYLKVVKNKLP